MKTTTVTSSVSRGDGSAGWLDRLARTALLAKLRALKHGQVILRDPEAIWVRGEPTDMCPLSVEVHVKDPRFYSLVAFEGSVGSGEAYMLGYWTCTDLTSLVRIFTINREVLNRLDSGLARLSAPFLRWYHAMRKNTRAGSQRNIAAHYDLGNEFYRLFLDETMTYSSGIFADDTTTLEQASRAKLDRICRKLRLGPNDHLLEIGTGWGSFALHAAQHYGCHVTTTTISRDQFTLARERINRAGLSGRITLLFEDYRDLRGTFTKLASIEMIEAVGWQYYDVFLRKCADLLASDGMLVLQAITMQDQEYDRARNSVDFIQRFIFPGGCLPSVTALCDAATRATDLKLFHFEDFTPHYARTLREWRTRFSAALDRVRALGYSEEFIRMWEFYLCYCEGGFLERHIACAQMVFTKPLCRAEPLLAGLS